MYIIYKFKVMHIDVDRKQFDFELLKNGILSVTYKPIMSRYDKKKHFCMFEPGSKFYKLAYECYKDSSNWVYLCYLADFVVFYDKKIIPSI